MAHKKRVLISTVEKSAETHAARLVRGVAAADDAVEFIGFGGPHLEAAGCRLLADTIALATMGLGFLGQAGGLLRTVRLFDRALRREQPDAVVLVDSPGLNFLFARLARWRGVPVVYYICPQIWAWAPWRLGKLLRYTDLLLPILPFEADVLRNETVPVVPVRHPLLDEIDELDRGAGSELRRQHGIDDDQQVIALLPGSRHQEVRQLMPLFRRILDEAKLDAGRNHVLVSCFRDDFEAPIRAAMHGFAVPFDVLRTDSRVITMASDFVVVASGTASLEVAFLERPMMVLYYGGLWLRVVSATLAVTPYFSLPNLLGAALNDGAPIVPERLCRGTESAALGAELKANLGDGERRATMAIQLRQVREHLERTSGNHTAAEALTDFLSRLT